MRQHGDVASTCIHGFAPGTCLICQTLQSGSATATKQGNGRSAGRRAGRTGPVPAPAPVPVRPDAVTPDGRRRGGVTGAKVMGWFVLALLAVIAVWIVAGLVVSVLRILELVLVAAVAGWVGWKAGVHHGRRARA
jgi:hypothetical protein